MNNKQRITYEILREPKRVLRKNVKTEMDMAYWTNEELQKVNMVATEKSRGYQIKGKITTSMDVHVECDLKF